MLKKPFMKVVILPDENGDGGAPTLLEIKQIERRVQLQKTGRAEYYDFDTALTIRDDIKDGYSLEDQMMDDSDFSSLPPNIFKKRREERENTKEDVCGVFCVIKLFFITTYFTITL